MDNTHNEDMSQYHSQEKPKSQRKRKKGKEYFLANDKVPKKMPLWLYTNWEPEQPSIFPIVLEKAGLPKATIYPKPLDWLQAVYWIQRKEIKSTRVLSHDDKLPNCGKDGYRDFFEELSRIISVMYPNLNPANYFDRYFCFAKLSPFKPEENSIDENIHFKELCNELDQQREFLEEQKNLSELKISKRIERKKNKIQKFEKYDCAELASFNITPYIDYRLSTNRQILEFLNNEDKSKYFIDKDCNQRNSNSRFVLKKTLKTFLVRKKQRISIKKIAKEQKLSYYRVKRAFNAIEQSVDNINTDEQIEAAIVKMYIAVNEKQIKFEKDQHFLLTLMSNLIHKKGIKQTASKIQSETRQCLDRMNKGHIKLGITKVKYLLKKHLRLTRKKKYPLNKKQTEEYSINIREKWIRFYLQLTNRYNSANVLAMDETAWYFNMDSKYCWAPIVQVNAVAQTSKGRRVTLIAAMSTHGVESLMLINGSCSTIEWCYFAYHACQRFYQKYKNEKWAIREEGVLLYDNAKAHISGFSSWFMRQLPGIKLTIPPCTPEYNPIEHLFGTLKTFPDGTEHRSLTILMRFILVKIAKIERWKCKSFFQRSFVDMAQFLLKKNQPKKAGELLEKIALQEPKKQAKNYDDIVDGQFINIHELSELELMKIKNQSFPQQPQTRSRTRSRKVQSQKLQASSNQELGSNYTMKTRKTKDIRTRMKYKPSTQKEQDRNMSIEKSKKKRGRHKKNKLKQKDDQDFQISIEQEPINLQKSIKRKTSKKRGRNTLLPLKQKSIKAQTKAALKQRKRKSNLSKRKKSAKEQDLLPMFKVVKGESFSRKCEKQKIWITLEIPEMGQTIRRKVKLDDTVHSLLKSVKFPFNQRNVFCQGRDIVLESTFRMNRIQNNDQMFAFGYDKGG